MLRLRVSNIAQLPGDGAAAGPSMRALRVVEGSGPARTGKRGGRVSVHRRHAAIMVAMLEAAGRAGVLRAELQSAWDAGRVVPIARPGRLIFI